MDKSDFSIVGHYEFMGSQQQTELGFGNRLILNTDTLLANLQQVQDNNKIDRTNPEEFKQISIKLFMKSNTRPL